MTESNVSDAKDRLVQGNTESESESMLWRGKYSGKNMTGIWICLAIGTILLLVAMLAVSALREQSIAWIAFLVLVLIGWVGNLGLMIYYKLSHFYEITNQRLKHREGIVIRSNNRIELIDIDDVSYKQGPIQALLNVGDIVIRSSDTSHPELVMNGIADVKRVADIIDDARRAERRKRGLHIESI